MTDAGFEGLRRAGSQVSSDVRRAILLFWLTGLVLYLSVRLTMSLRGLLVEVVVAVFLSFAIEPIVNTLEDRGMRRSFAAALSLLAVLLAVLIFAGLMGQLIATQLEELAGRLPADLRRAQEWANTEFGLVVNTETLADEIQSGDISTWAERAANNLYDVGTGMFNVLFQVLTITLLTYYLSADGPRMRHTVCSVLPPSKQGEVQRVWDLAIAKTGAYISSRVLLALVSSLFHWGVFSIIGLESPVALALWVGVVSQFIPAIGTYLAGILPVLVAVGSSDPKRAIWVIIALLVYQQVENYVLQPRITAQTLDMHPGVAIVAVLAGTSVLGGIGAILALPFVATVSGFASAYVERHEVIEHTKRPHAMAANPDSPTSMNNDEDNSA